VAAVPPACPDGAAAAAHTAPAATLLAALGASAAWALLLAQLEQEMLADTSAATLSIIIPVRCSRRWSGVHG
jgi:hypothetical protein